MLAEGRGMWKRLRPRLREPGHCWGRLFFFFKRIGLGFCARENQWISSLEPLSRVVIRALFTRMRVTKFLVSKCPDSSGCSLMLRRPRSFAVLSLLFLSRLIYSVRSRVYEVRAIVNFHQSERVYHRGITFGEGEKRRDLGRQSIRLVWMGRD